MAALETAGQAPADSAREAQQGQDNGISVMAERGVGETPIERGQHAQTQTQTDNASQQQQQAQQEDFDADRARALIEKLRPFEKQARQYERELKALQSKVKEYEDANLTEQQKRERELEELQSRKDYLELEVRALRVDGAIEREAREAGAHYPDMMPALLKDADLEMDEYGKPSPDAIRAALKSLKEQRPALFASAGSGKQSNPPPSVAPTNTERGPNSGGWFTRSQLTDPVFYREHKAAIDAAVLNNRIKEK